MDFMVTFASDEDSKSVDSSFGLGWLFHDAYWLCLDS